MNLAVFCGSRHGHDPIFTQAVMALGATLAKKGVRVIYGGGDVGLMGCIANAVLSHGGEVVGVIPSALTHQEIAHTGLTQLHEVAGMHERKAKIASLADAFVALPGGIGTLEEIFEAWTWGQIGLQQKPCAFYNIAGYYQPLLNMVTGMQQAGFVKQSYLEAIILEDTPERLLSSLTKAINNHH